MLNKIDFYIYKKDGNIKNTWYRFYINIDNIVIIDIVQADKNKILT